MIFSGDEFGNSQSGNNNPYCQDNETGWVDWKAMEKNQDLLDYVKFLSKLRFSNRIIHSRTPFKMMDYISCGYPDLSCHGREAWRPDMSGHSHMIGFLFCGLYEKDEAQYDYIYVAFNMHWQRQELALPQLPEGLKWEILTDTDPRQIKPQKRQGANRDKQTDRPEENIFTELMAERSTRIYVSVVDKDYKPKKKTTGRKSSK